MIQGASAQYTVSVSQVDRSAASGIYAGLKAAYPWEFGTDTLGTGHRGAGYEVRTNTYARDVSVEDWWEVGLDFSNATNFNNVSNGGVLNTTLATSKKLSWSAIADLPMGVTSTANVTLTGNLVSNNSSSSVSPFNSANKQVSPSNFYAWANCAYAYSGQLNQLSSADSSTRSIHPLSATDLVSVAANGNTTKWSKTGVTQVLESCVNVAVIPAPTPIAVLGINVDGEFRTVTAPSGATPPGLDQADRSDVFSIGDVFFYVYRLENSGNGVANDVLATFATSGNATTFGTSITVWRRAGGLWSVNPAGYSTVGTNTASNKSVSIPSMGVNDVVYFVIPATAANQGGQVVTYSVTYSNPPGFQTLPLVSTDSTTVQP
jgi:hypothetical protein